MINYLQSLLDEISVHYVPNRIESDAPTMSTGAIRVSDEPLKDFLLKMFFSGFKEPDYYSFDNIDEDYNIMYSLAKQIFESPNQLHQSSMLIADHLFKQSNHPNIKSGELMMAYVDEVLIDDEMLSAIAIVKSESKEQFMKLDQNHSDFLMTLEKGIYPSKIDKACIIFNTNASTGYKCCVLDKTKPGEESVFWNKKFLDIKPFFNDYQKTKVYIQATKSFIDERMKPLYDVEKQDEAFLLNSSKSYFETHEDFEEEGFLNELFGEQDAIKQEFKDYKQDYEDEKGLQVFDDFKVSNAAVKNQSRVFKSVIKLDKNFHVYVHGNRNMIEKGVDDEGRKFYKLYFNDEH